jgi:fatty-acyl-CoA synthase
MPSKGIKLDRTPVFGSVAPATPTVNTIALRRADFASSAEALDYAAQGDTGANFYAGSGKLATVLPYRTLRLQAHALARRLLSLPAARGARVAVIGRDHPGLLRFFFACQYAGLVPVALPASVNLGGHAAYVARLRGLLEGCDARRRWRRASSCGSCARPPRAWASPSPERPPAFDELARA